MRNTWYVSGCCVLGAWGATEVQRLAGRCSRMARVTVGSGRGRPPPAGDRVLRPAVPASVLDQVAAGFTRCACRSQDLYSVWWCCRWPRAAAVSEPELATAGGVDPVLCPAGRYSRWPRAAGRFGVQGEPVHGGPWAGAG